MIGGSPQDGFADNGGRGASSKALAKRCRHFPALAISSDGPMLARTRQNLTGETASSVSANSSHQRTVRLSPDYSFEPPPSISGGSATANTGSLTLEMLHEIRARMVGSERKEAELNRPARA